MSDALACCVVVPVKDGAAILADCLRTLVPALLDGACVVVVDDGSRAPLSREPALAPFVHDGRFAFLRHAQTRGAGASRDAGIAWARAHGAPIVILLDADCLVEEDFISVHLESHHARPDVVCRGGSIVGRGTSAWARLDGAMSWFTSMPEAPEGPVNPPYHLPTTNLSIKLRAFGDVPLFDHRLRTGEDVVFFRQTRATGHAVVFGRRPRIYHRDRETLGAFLRHQYRWSLHTYVVRCGLNRLDLRSRLVFAVAFLIGSPGYVAFATWLTLRPLLRRSWSYLALTPCLMLMYAIKSVGVIVGTLAPGKALMPEPPGSVADLT